jgi:PAS domain S-box-containing protein
MKAERPSPKREDRSPSGGEMARRLIEFDWSNHPLGPMEDWPQSFKTIIHSMLNSRSPMWIGWGAELYFFCNDACLPILGISRNWRPGESARKVWGDAWPAIGPRAESAVQTGQATWDESLLLLLERQGYVEETYHRFFYSPIPNDSGAIAGMLCVVTDDTERLIVARRLELLRKLGADLAPIDTEEQLFTLLRARLAESANDIPFALVYNFTDDRKKADLACAHGAEPGDAIAPESIACASSSPVWPVREILAGTANYLDVDLSSRIDDVPRGPWRVPPRQAVIVPIARLEEERPGGFLIAGINPYRLFDIDYQGFVNVLAGQVAAGLSKARAYEQERRRAEQPATLDRAPVRRHTDKHDHDLIELLPAAVYTCDARGRITLFNDAAVALWGRAPEIHKDEWCGSVKIYRPDGSPLPVDLCPMAVTLREGRAVRGEEILIERPDGSRRNVMPYPEPIRDASGAIVGAINMLVDITDHKNAQRALLESEERFVRFMRHLPGLAWIKDANGRYIFASDSALKVFGRTQEELQGKTDEDLFPSETAALFRENDRRALANEAGVESVEQLRHHDGTLHHSIVHKFSIPGPSDKPTLIGGIAIDITERKCAEDALRESEERLRMATQTGSVGVWDWDIGRNRVSWTDSLYAIHGLQPEDFDGTVEGFAALVHPDDRERIAAAIRSALADETPYEIEFRLLRPDRSEAWIFTNAMVLRDIKGRPVRMIGATVDITERKGVEQELRRRNRHIQLLSETLAQLLRASDSESIVRDLFNKVAAHIGADTYFNFMVTDDGEALELHSCAGISEEILNSIRRLDFDQAICGSVAEIRQAITVNDIQNSDDDKAALVRGLGIQTYVCNPLMVGERLFGTLSFASHTRKSFDDHELEFLRIVSQYTAIALDRLRAAKALGESEERLRCQAKELEQQLIATGRLVSLGEITASMAHEFNNPLGIILGFVEDLLINIAPEDPNFRPLQIIDEEAKRCKRIIQELMDYTRPRAAALSSTSLNIIIAKTLSLVENRLYKQKIAPETAVPDDLPAVYADYQQLEQVLVNLYLNAIDAMPNGGTLSVSAQTCRDGEEPAVVVAVSDTGFGIDDDSLAKIFHPFFTAKKTRGMGLGLPICERIVKNHGGRIEVESLFGRGTTFKVYLPLIENSPARPNAVQPPPK